MSQQNAPLYIMALDLAQQMAERHARWSPADQRRLGDALNQSAQELLVEISLALSFPEDRMEALRRADHLLVRQRVLLRLARNLGLSSPGGHLHLMLQLDEAGRMLGGWRKQERRRLEALASSASSPHLQGSGSPVASIV
jgi:hypothetical protein